MVTQFSTQLRKDRTRPPPPSLRESSRELTAGDPELDMLLTVHLQVCKALLQVLRDLGKVGEEVRWKGRHWPGDPGGLGVLCKGLTLKLVGSTVQGPEACTFRAIEIEEVPLGKQQARPGCSHVGLNQPKPGIKGSGWDAFSRRSQNSNPNRLNLKRKFIGS